MPAMPLGSNLARPRWSIVSIDLQWDKSKKTFFSETTRPKASIFCMSQCLLVLIINCANHAPGVKFGHAPGVNSLHRLTIENTSKFNISKASRWIYTASLGSRKGCILLLVRSNWDSGCHGNIYVLMEKIQKSS